jgi:hypothetical protein
MYATQLVKIDTTHPIAAHLARKNFTFPEGTTFFLVIEDPGLRKWMRKKCIRPFLYFFTHMAFKFWRKRYYDKNGGIKNRRKAVKNSS